MDSRQAGLVRMERDAANVEGRKGRREERREEERGRKPGRSDETMKGIGTEWLIEASGCDADALSNIPRLQHLFNRVITELNLNPLGDATWHQFPDTGGVTGFVLLSESHLACHTWPELGAFALDLFC